MGFDSSPTGGNWSGSSALGSIAPGHLPRRLKKISAGRYQAAWRKSANKRRAAKGRSKSQIKFVGATHNLLPRPAAIRPRRSPSNALARVDIHVHKLPRAALAGHFLPPRRQGTPSAGGPCWPFGHALTRVDVEVREGTWARLRGHLVGKQDIYR